ncbi:MazG-like family protein [Riemerella anatipestifer]|uniref:MazG-like family protein n=1 Tax=Riemerella anatipestifer TaxID=34085 RepID=UPI001C6E86A9|nr:MazG-like family protein [Riemerella anatipestifer]QYR02313.1 MazG-like family protein [Riemerella anatipestifer]
MEKLIKQIKQWAEDRNILAKVTPTKQALKTLEECTELLTAIADDDGTEIKDAIGDIVVTLIIQCEMQNLNFIDCVQSAYDVISKRTGKMINGQFVKDK